MIIYMVECGFADKDREAAWNAWYSDHQKDFLDVPEFHSAQRFIAVSPSHPKYRAMYTLESEAAFESPVYKGFRGGNFPLEWRNAINDFHRNLFDGNGLAPAVAQGSCLVVVDEPDSARMKDFDLQIWTAIGLDKSVAQRGIAVVDDARGAALAEERLPRVSVYRPLTQQRHR
jgi:hypothetical protein